MEGENTIPHPEGGRKGAPLLYTISPGSLAYLARLSSSAAAQDDNQVRSVLAMFC